MKNEEILSIIFFGVHPESPGYHKKLLWERLPAAKLNDRGWKPFPQPIQLVFPNNRINYFYINSRRFNGK